MPSTLRVSWGATLAIGLALLAKAEPADAQQSAPPVAGSAPAAPSAYRPPALALVQPAAGGSIPQDRPVVVFRFAPGEAADPIDAGSFAVIVDGQSRNALFQVTAGEAWGPIFPTKSGAESVAGSHQVTARICSTRGACSETSATVVVVGSSAATENAAGRKRSLVDVLLSVARKLLVP
jgi:hypothetical protein